MANDAVNHPSHYTDGKIEVITYIDDKNFNYCRGNAIKYISRAGKKNPEKEIEDLEKAEWYIHHEIERLQKLKEGYEKGIEKTNAEIEILKIQNKNLEIAFDRLEAENERLTERLKQVLLSIDTVKEMNTMCNIDEQRKQAVKEFAEKLKKRSYCDNNFMDGKWHRYVFVDEIDELLKEYEAEA